MKEANELILFAFIFLLLGFLMGLCFDVEDDGLELYDKVTGLWKSNFDDENWIGIEVGGRSIDFILETCRHEVAHEIYWRKNKENFDILDSEDFAKFCEKEENWEDCLK